MPRRTFFEKASQLSGAFNPEYNPFNNGLRSPSPSLNFVFGNTHILPEGYSVLVAGPPKAGKTVISYLFAGQLHKDDPEACVVKFNTEFRESGQLTPEMAQSYGIDLKRYMAYEVNDPTEVYDRIEKEIAAWCEEGDKIRLIIIDSLNGVMGRKMMASETVDAHGMGDGAHTNKDGLKRILAVQRKHKISVILTSHVGAEFDKFEQDRGNKLRIAQGFGALHHAEYFLWVEPWKSKDGRQTLAGVNLEDTSVKDMTDKGFEKTGQKLKVTMKDSTMGPKGRTGIFTHDFKHGVINQFEEVFTLGYNRNVITREGNTYRFGDRKWVGKPEILRHLESDTALQEAIVKELRARDLAGHYRAMDQALKEAVEAGKEDESMDVTTSNLASAEA